MNHPPKPAKQSPRIQAGGLPRRRPAGQTAKGLDRVLHELEVHQSELERQNEELLRVQVELAQSRDRFSDLYDFAPAGFVALDQEGVILEVNLTATKLLGVVRGKLLGRKFHRFLSHDSQDAFHLHQQQIFLHRQRHTCVLVLKAADGRSFPARVQSSVFEDPLLHQSKCHSVLLDLTAERQAEATLRTEQARQAGFAASGSEGIIESQNGRIVDCNAQAAAILGRSVAELKGMAIAGLIAPGGSVRMTEVLRLNRKAVSEQNILRPDNSQMTVEWHGRPVSRGSQRRITVLRDVTGPKRTERALRELNTSLEQRMTERTSELAGTNEHLQTIMDGVQIGILTYDSHGIIQSANPAAERILGRDMQEIAGQDIRGLVEVASPGRPVNFFKLPMADESRFATVREIHARHKDGTEIMLELTVAEFVYHRRRQFVVLLNDVTGRRKLERDLLEVSENERQRLGHELHDSLGQQLHGVHFIATLLQEELSKESSSHAGEAGRLAKHIGQAIELTRGIARGLQPVGPEPEGLMHTLMGLAVRTRELFGVNCRFECPVPVHVHRHHVASHLFRIAQEAVNNAVKHGNPTLIRIQLTATPQHVVLGIRDNGRGIRLQAGAAAGMGLHIMQHRADAIPASLVVQRRRGGGTEVVCTVARPVLSAKEEGNIQPPTFNAQPATISKPEVSLRIERP